jgi:hypothetical protein
MLQVGFGKLTEFSVGFFAIRYNGSALHRLRQQTMERLPQLLTSLTKEASIL